jgi:superfamily II DNA or RNA helicase
MAKKIATINIIDEVNVIIEGVNQDHTELLMKQFRAHPPGYNFNPKYKLGVWDGFINYYKATGQTWVHLLPRILPKIKNYGYRLVLNDSRKSKSYHPDTIEADFFYGIDTAADGKWMIRDYQVEMINTLIEARSGIGIAATGSGKTSMVAALAKAYELAGSKRSIIIVPDKSLTAQTKADYLNFGLDVGEFSGTTKDIEHKHVVSTWQALQNTPTIIREFTLVIVDEAHGLRGQVIQKLLNDHGKQIPHRYAVTGTLPKSDTDKMAMKITAGDVLCEIPASLLIKQGHLPNLHIDVMTTDVELQDEYDNHMAKFGEIEPMTYIQFKNRFFEDYAQEKKYLQTDTARLQWLSNFVTKLSKQQHGNVLCLVNGIQIGEDLEEITEGSVFVSGKTTKKASDRKDVYDLFSTNDHLIVFATVNIASTGLNIERIFNMVFIDIGASFTRVIQTIGRGLRKADDKQFVNVFDIGANLKYGKKHKTERVKYYKEAQYPYTIKPVLKLK